MKLDKKDYLNFIKFREEINDRLFIIARMYYIAETGDSFGLPLIKKTSYSQNTFTFILEETRDNDEISITLPVDFLISDGFENLVNQDIQEKYEDE